MNFTRAFLTCRPKHNFVLMLVFTLLSVLVAHAEDGILKMRSNEEGVSVSIAGKTVIVGKEWKFIEIPAGSHTATASKKDFQPSQKSVKVEANRVTTVEFSFAAASPFIVEKPKDQKLVRGYGNLTIITDIPGATISLNGREVPGEVSPMTIKRLAQGSWQVVARLNSQVQNAKMYIRPNQDHVVRLFFDEANRRRHEAKLRAEQERQRRLKELTDKKARDEALKKQKESAAKAEADRIGKVERTPIHTYQYEYGRKSLIWGEKDRNYPHWVDDHTISFSFKDQRGNTVTVQILYQFKGGFKYSILYGDQVKSGSRSKVVVNMNRKQTGSKEWAYSGTYTTMSKRISSVLDGNYGTFRIKSKSTKVNGDYVLHVDVFPIVETPALREKIGKAQNLWNDETAKARNVVRGIDAQLHSLEGFMKTNPPKVETQGNTGNDTLWKARVTLKRPQSSAVIAVLHMQGRRILKPHPDVTLRITGPYMQPVKHWKGAAEDKKLKAQILKLKQSRRVAQQNVLTVESRLRKAHPDLSEYFPK